MHTQETISCHLHDYIETFCVYHYELEITTNQGETIIAKAKDTKTIHGMEYLLLEHNGTMIEVALHTIKRIHVLTENAKYSNIEF